MFPSHVHLRDPKLAQLLGHCVRVGEAFLFLTGDPEDREWNTWRREHFPSQRRSGPLIVPLLAPRPVEIPGGTVQPFRLPQLHPRGVTTDKAVYRAGRDTVRLLAFSLDTPGAQGSLIVRCNGSIHARLSLQLDSHGMVLVPLHDLPSGEYEVNWSPTPGWAGPDCVFTVAEYRLAPLVASLEDRRWDEKTAHLFVQLRLETFGVPVTGDVRLELTDQGRRIGEVRAGAVEGIVKGTMALTGSGPHAINVQLDSDPSRTASVPLIGSKTAERSSTLFSTLGADVSGSLLPGKASRSVRGIYLSEGASRDTPFRLERVDTIRARLTATVSAGPVCVVAVSLLDHDQRREVVRETIAEGESIDIDVPGPAAMVLIGALIEGTAWEGWAGLVHPETLTARVRVPESCSPGNEVVVAVEADQAESALVYLVVKDARLLSPGTPNNCLAGQIKSAVARVPVARSVSPTRFLDEFFRPRTRAEISDALVLRGVVSAAQLAEARDVVRRTGARLDDVLVHLGYTTNEEFTRTLAAVYRCPFVDLSEITIPPAVIELLPEAVARENTVLPLGQEGGTLKVALCDPADRTTIEKLQFILNTDIESFVAVPEQVVAAINQLYGQPEIESVTSMLAEFYDTAIDFTETELAASPRRRRPETSLDLNAECLAEPSSSASREAPSMTRDEPEVIFAGLLPMKQGRAATIITLGPGFTDYIAEAFVVSGIDWAAAEARFRAEKDPFVVLDLPAFVHPLDCVVGRVHVGAKSGRMRVRVTCNGAPVPLRLGERTVAPEEPLNGQQMALTLIARPGTYEATVEDLSGANARATVRVEEPGKLESVVCSLRFLEAGQRLSRDDDPSVLALHVLPGLDSPLQGVAGATADYSHLCCEQTAAKIVAGCAMYALAEKDSQQRVRAEAIIRAGIHREQLMWLRGRGFKMYPHLPDQVSPYLSPRAARYLWNLSLIGEMDSVSLPPALRDAIDLGLKMAEDVTRAHQMIWPPEKATTWEEAYAVARFNRDPAVRASAIEIVRQRTAPGPSCSILAAGDVGYLKGAVRERTEAAYAAAALFCTGEGRDRRIALTLANKVLQHLGPEKRLYSTVDSVAALALLAELRSLRLGDVIEVDGVRLSVAEALDKNAIRALTGVAGVIAVEVTRRIVEDWGSLRSAVAMKVILEKNGRGGQCFRAGDGLDLVVRLESGYLDGDLLWVALPDALSWVLGGAQVKRFAVDLAGRSEIQVPLAATGLTLDERGQAAP